MDISPTFFLSVGLILSLGFSWASSATKVDSLTQNRPLHLRQIKIGILLLPTMQLPPRIFRQKPFPLILQTQELPLLRLLIPFLMQFPLTLVPLVVQLRRTEHITLHPHRRDPFLAFFLLFMFLLLTLLLFVLQGYKHLFGLEFEGLTTEHDVLAGFSTQELDLELLIFLGF